VAFVSLGVGIGSFLRGWGEGEVVFLMELVGCLDGRLC